MVTISKPTYKQEKFMLALMTEPTTRKACEVAGISETTGYKWLKSDVFNRGFRDMRQMAFQATTARINALSQKALSTLEDILDDKKSPIYARLQASQSILDIYLRTHQVVTMESIIDEQEERLKALETRNEL